MSKSLKMTEKEILRIQKRYLSYLYDVKDNKFKIIRGNKYWSKDDLIFEIENLTSDGLEHIKNLFKLDKEMAIKQRRKKLEKIIIK